MSGEEFTHRSPKCKNGNGGRQTLLDKPVIAKHPKKNREENTSYWRERVMLEKIAQ
jgi:hypothetical protein